MPTNRQTADRGEPYSLRDVVQRVNLKPHQVIEWAEKRVVEPTYGDTTGSGSYRRYSHDNLVEFAVARDLVETGMAIGSVAKLLQFLRNDLGKRTWKNYGIVAVAARRKENFEIAGWSPAGQEKPWSWLATVAVESRSSWKDSTVWIVLNIESARKGIQEV